MNEKAPVQTEQADPQTILAGMGDGFLAVDDSWSITYANAQGQESLRASMSDDIDSIGLQIQADDATVLADSGRLRQVFENLLGNASEHGETVSEIELGLLDDGSGFYVADNGVGIPTEERERVFEPGYTTRDNGTGFGLYIVQDIGRAHDWNVCVTSAATGGARFEISGVEFPDGSFPE